mgnify:FL=1
MSNGKEFICEEELRRIGLSGREEFFSGRRIGQFAYLSGRKELVTQKKEKKFVCQKEEIVQKIEYKCI